jgi:hypothetical protein
MPHTPFHTELVARLTDPMKQKPYKESSVKPVWTYLRTLNGGQDPTSLDFLLDRAVVLPYLEKYAVSTQRSIVFIIRNVAKDFKREDLLAIWKENIEETQEGKGLPPKGEKSETQKQAYARVESDKGGDAWDTLVRKTDEMNREFERTTEITASPLSPARPEYLEEGGGVYVRIGKTEKYLNVTKQRELPYVVPNLYTKFPPRRNLDYTEMKIATDYKDDMSPDHNYLAIGIEKGAAEERVAMRFVFNRYKTSGVYHRQVFDVPDDLVAVLKNWIRATNKKDGDYLLTKVGKGIHNKGDTLRNDDITEVLHKVFGRGISTQMLRHMYLDKYNTPERKKIIEEMMGDAEQMAHSIGTQQQTYVKDKTAK